MFYFKVFDLKSKENLGVVSSLNFRCFNESRKIMLICEETQAQYIYLNSAFYKITNSKESSYEDYVAEVKLKCILKEEYEEYMQKQEKEKLEQK